MGAAKAIFSLLQSTGSAVWRADDVPAEKAAGPVIASGHAALDRELPGSGWPLGQLTELLTDNAGIGELSLLAPALAYLGRERRPIVWVMPPDTAAEMEARAMPYAPALAAAGIDLGRTMFVKPATPREALWTLEQALRASHLGAAIGWLPASASVDSDFKALRRLHLLAQRHRALAFVLRVSRHAQAPSPAALRLQLDAIGTSLAVTLLKRRGRPLLEPIALQLRPPHWAAPTLPREAAPAVNLQPAAKTALLTARSLQALLDH